MENMSVALKAIHDNTDQLETDHPLPQKGMESDDGANCVSEKHQPALGSEKVLSLDDVILEVKEFGVIKFPERGLFLSPWLKEESINMIYGWRGSGKTFLALALLDSITRGKNFGPWKCLKPVPCLFLDGEMTISDNKERFEVLGFISGERKSSLHIYNDHYANLKGSPRANLTDESWRAEIKSFLVDKKVKLWVVDNIASLAPGLDENKKQDWDPINQWLLDLRFHGISTILLHHESKDGKQRGTAAREDNLDVSIRLRRPADYRPEDGCRFIVEFTKSRVSHRDLSSIANREFRLVDQDGEMVWEHSFGGGNNKHNVLRLLNDGVPQKAIAERLGISKGHVSKIRSKAISGDLLTEQDKFTPMGYEEVSRV
jgi:putative DNA primase/helicase